MTPLMAAAYEGQSDLVASLVAAGADLTYTDREVQNQRRKKEGRKEEKKRRKRKEERNVEKGRMCALDK